MIIDGIDIYAEYGAMLLFEAETDPPKPTIETVSIPFGAELDISELDGAVGFSRREQTLNFYVKGGERALARFVNRFHGRTCEYTLPGDPYTYTGRFSFRDHERIVRHSRDRITAEVSADTWRKLPPTVFSINAAGGVVVDVQSGRMPVQPTITVQRPAVVVSEGTQAIVEAGSWVSDYVWWHEGMNTLYINTLTGDGDQLLEDIWDTPLADIWDKRLTELYWTDAPSTPKTLGEIWDVPLSEIWDTRIIELSNPISTDNPEYNATIYAEWGDL